MSHKSYFAVCGGPKPGIYDTYAEASVCCANQLGATVKKLSTEAARMWECSGSKDFASSAVHIEGGPRVSTDVSFLSCPFKEKDIAKKLGAKWDVARKAWYVPSGVAISPFARWLPGGAVDICPGASSAPGYPTVRITPSCARKAVYKVPSPLSVTAYREALEYSRPTAPLAGLLLCTDGSCPGNRNVATTTNEDGGRIGWWEHHTQVGMSTALAAIASMKAAAAGCFAAQAGFVEAATKADLEANVATKAELVAAMEANSVMKAELVVAMEAKSVVQAALVAAMEVNAAVDAELVAAMEATVAARVELAATIAAKEAATATEAITAVDAVAAASISAAFTTAAIAAVAVSVVAISVATAFGSPSLTPDSNGATPQPQSNMIMNELAELIAHNRQAALQLAAERMRQHKESDGAVAASAAPLAPLEALVRGGGFDWMRILDDN